MRLAVVALIKVPVRTAQALIDLLTSARFSVDGDSMLPTLANGQSVLAVRPRFSWNQIRRGDIVVFRHPMLADRTYIKRIAGLPGEDLRVEGGLVYLNGVLMEEPYLNGPAANRPEHDREWWLGPNEYFVLGDNRSDSQDSRTFGPIDRRLILGRVWFLCWPPGAWGPIPGKTGPAL